jgi:phage-related protein
MAGTNLGSAYVTIMPSAKGIKGSITKVLSGESASAGRSAGSSIVSGIKKVVAVAAIGKFIADTINAGGELQQNLGGTEAVFGEFAKNIQETAKDAYKNMGMSASDYMATANKMGSLFQGSGIEQQRALKLTSDAMQRAADVASVMGIDTSAAMESIAGAAKGNFTMMDNLGVAMNATTLSAYALEKGVNFKWDTASNAEKAELAMQMFMERTQQYAGNFARESEETFSGSFGALKAAWDNLRADLSLGNDITGDVSNLLSTAVTFIQNNLLPMIGNVIKGIPAALRQLLTTAFQNVPEAVDSAIGFINGLVEGIRTNSGALFEGVAELWSAVWSALTETDWVGLAGSLITLLWEGIKAAAPAIWEGLKEVGATAKEWFESIDWGAVGSTVIRLIGEGIGNLGNLIWEGLSAIGQTAKDKFGEIDWSTAGADAFHALVDGLVAIGSTLWEAIKGIAATAAETFTHGDTDWGQVGMDILQAIGHGIGAALQFIWEALRTAGSAAMEAFTTIDWNQAGKDAVNAIIDGIKWLGTHLWAALKTIGRSAWEGFRDINWHDVGVNIIEFIKNGIMSVGSFIWGALTEIGSKAWEGFKNLDWVQAGIDIINGIIEGIKSVGHKIGESISGFAKDAVKTVKNVLGIESPSKVFRDQVGKWIPLGIAAGITDDADAVTDAINGIAKGAVEDAGTIPLAFSGTVAPGAAGGNVITNYFNVSGAENPEEFAIRVSRQLRMEMELA